MDKELQFISEKPIFFKYEKFYRQSPHWHISKFQSFKTIIYNI